MMNNKKKVTRVNITSKKLKKKKYLLISKRNTDSYERIRKIMNEYGLVTVRQLGLYTFMKNRYKRVMRNYSEDHPVYRQVLKKLSDYHIIDKDNYRISQINEKNFLNRRFQTIVAKKYGLTMLQARQKITHGFAYFKNKRRKICSFLVKADNEQHVTLHE